MTFGKSLKKTDKSLSITCATSSNFLFREEKYTKLASDGDNFYFLGCAMILRPMRTNWKK